MKIKNNSITINGASCKSPNYYAIYTYSGEYVTLVPVNALAEWLEKQDDFHGVAYGRKTEARRGVDGDIEITQYYISRKYKPVRYKSVRSAQRAIENALRYNDSILVLIRVNGLWYNISVSKLRCMRLSEIIKEYTQRLSNKGV